MFFTCKIELELSEIRQLEGETEQEFENRCDIISDAIAALLEEGGNTVESVNLRFDKVYYV
jgi:hypothetical protein